MFKVVGVLFLMSASGLAAALYFRWPTVFWQLNITMGLAGITLRCWFSKQSEDERADAIWGKYERAGQSKVPHYHDL